MASGTVDQQGFTVAPADLPGAGDSSWASVSGIEPWDPLVSGPSSSSSGPYDVASRGGLVSLPPEGGGATAYANQPASMDNWRDLLDFRGSPAPWVLLLAFAAIGWVAVGASARAGPAAASFRVGR